MKKIEDILTQCIDDVQAGRCSLEDCLSKYPSMRQQLEPLLRLALRIEGPPDVKPSAAFKVRARVQLMEQIHARQAVTKWPWSRYTGQMKPILHRKRFSMVPIIIAIVMAISAAGGGTVLAAQGSLPGDVLYPVKLGIEKVGLIFADEAADAKLWLKFADTRLEEIAALDEKGRPERIGIAVNGYDEAIAMAMAKVGGVSGKGLEVGDLSALVAETTSAHLSVLDDLADVVAEQALEAIARAKEVSISGYENALRTLAGENPARAMEINLAAALGRLNSARANAEANDIEGLEVALQEFQALNEFGEEISQIAQGLGEGTTTVHELVTAATSVQLAVLGEVLAIVPEQAKGAIEEAMSVSVEGYERAVEALSEAGALGDIPAEPPIPEGIPGEPPIPEGIPGEPPIPEGIPGEPPIPGEVPVEPPIPEGIPGEPPIPEGIPDEDDEDDEGESK